MAEAQLPEKTSVGLSENVRVYEILRGLPPIISWWKKIHEESLGKDLIILTEEKYDRIILNGKEIKSN